MRLRRPRGPGGKVRFEPGVWSDTERDVLIYRPLSGDFPRSTKSCKREHYWCLLGTTCKGFQLVHFAGLQERKFNTRLEAIEALEAASASRASHSILQKLFV